MFSVFRKNHEEPVSGHTFSVCHFVVPAVSGTNTFLATKSVHPLAVTVTLDADGGSCPDGSISTFAGSKIGSLPDCTRSDHQFVKWVDLRGREVTEKSVVTSDLTVLKAVYSEPVDLVLHYGVGVQDGNPSTVKVWPGFEIGALPRPEGSSDLPYFVAWVAPSGETVTSSTVYDGTYTSVEARYVNSSYTVTQVGTTIFRNDGWDDTTWEMIYRVEDYSSDAWFRDDGSGTAPNGTWYSADNPDPDTWDGPYISWGNTWSEYPYDWDPTITWMRIDLVGYERFSLRMKNVNQADDWTSYGNFVIALEPDISPADLSAADIMYMSEAMYYDWAAASTSYYDSGYGSNPEVEHEFSLPDSGEHFIYVGYRNSNNYGYGNDGHGHVLIRRLPS